MRRATGVCAIPIAIALVAVASRADTPSKDLLVLPGISGRPGGALLYSQRVAPKTLNPVTAADSASREVIGCMVADLIHINRQTQQTEPALAKSWKVSADGLHYTLELRRGMSFSDGHPFDADDVVFSFQVYLDAQVGSPQRDLLLIGGKPVVARRLDAYRVAFDLPGPYAAAERLFDGFAILPRHRLERAYREGKFREAWGLRSPVDEIAGMGPFRLKEYAAGQRIVLERNPYYWKSDESGNALPYLAQISFVLAGSEDLQVLRFQSGEADVISRVSARNFVALDKDRQRRGYDLVDAGPGLEYSFLFFNLNDLRSGAASAIASRQAVFRRVAFRQAVSQAIDRGALVRLVYGGRATPLATPVPVGNKRWVNEKLPRPVRSVEQARRTLATGGFSWSPDGALLDPEGHKVEFSIATSAGNTDRVQMATMIQDDLKPLGMTVNVVPLEFASLVARVTQTHDYEACLLSLSEPDADPNPDMAFWLSSAGSHLWHPEQKTPATAWEAEIDSLMRRQMETQDYAARKLLFDRVQEIGMQNMPVVPLLTPHILAGAQSRVGNFRPAVMDHYVLWNIETLYLRGEASAGLR